MDKVAAAFAKDKQLRLLSKTKLIATLKPQGISSKDIEAYLSANRDTTRERFARPSTKFKQSKITAPPYSYQIDVINVDGAGRVLLLVEVLSRKAFAYPLKSNKASDVLAAYKKFIKAVGHKPHQVQGDDFFNAKVFVEYNCKQDIDVITGVAATDHISKGDRLGIIDRATRTLKSLIAKRSLADDDPNPKPWLSEIVDLYNRTPNAGINNDTPDALHGDPASLLEKFKVEVHANNEGPHKQVSQSFKVGDYVRRLLAKSAFDKEGVNMSEEIYEVTEVAGTRLTVKDASTGEAYTRTLKPNEVTIVGAPPKNPDALAITTKAPTKVATAKKQARVTRKVVQQERIEVHAPTLVAPDTAPKVRTRNQKDIDEHPVTEGGVLPKDHYIIDKVLGKKEFVVNGRKVLKYKVSWKGYKDRTYEPLSNLQRPAVKRLVDAYERKLKNTGKA